MWPPKPQYDPERGDRRIEGLLRAFPAAGRAIVAAACLTLGLAGPANAKPRAAFGLRISLIASGLPHPTDMAIGPDRRIYVTTESGEILRMRSLGGPATVWAVASDWTSALGLAWRGDRLYVSALDSSRPKGRRGVVLMLRDRDGNLRAEAPAKVILAGVPEGRHQQDNIRLGPDGRLYLGVGSTCDACAERHPWSASVLAFSTSGRNVQVVARGLRNPYGLRFDPGGRLWTTDEGRDEPDGVKEELNVLVGAPPMPRQHFGWPECWSGHRPGVCRRRSDPIRTYEAHSAVVGFDFAPSAWGPRWVGDVITAHWGQYYASTHGRYVSRTDFDGSGKSHVTRIVEGFEHPIAVLRISERTMLIADYGAIGHSRSGSIWRLTRR